MNKKSKYFFIIFTIVMSFLTFEIIYLYTFKSSTKEELAQKNSFVKVTGLPDLAISNEAMFIRHRTLSDTYTFEASKIEEKIIEIKNHENN